VWVAGNHHARALGIEDSVDSGFRHLKRISMDYGEDAIILNYAVHARVALKYFEDNIGLKMCVIRNFPDYYYGIDNDGMAEGRMLEVLPFPGASLGDWQTRTRVSPHVTYGLNHADIYGKGGPANMQQWDYGLMAERLSKDERCLGPGLAAYFVKGVLDRNIPMHTGVNVAELIGDGTRIVGVRGTKDGKNIFVKANRGVVVAVSSYERNKTFNRTLGASLEVESMVLPTVDGSNFRLAGPVGARIAKVPDIMSIGFHVPGEEQESGGPLWRNALLAIGLPHTILVNRAGKRFANETFYRAVGYALDVIDGGTQTHPNFPCWAILDDQARGKYAFGSVMPGQDLPEGLGVKADTLAALAAKIGVDAKGLEETVAAFNGYCEKSADPEFGRGSHPWARQLRGDPYHKPHPNLGSLTKPPFHAVELHRLGGSAIPATGLVTDHHARVMGWDDKPIAGLYAAGNSVARLESGAAMQSGVSNGRGMTHGYLAGRHAAGKPSELLQKEIDRLGL
jgi:3-oxosteroid 1-dehydrogenase